MHTFKLNDECAFGCDKKTLPDIDCAGECGDRAHHVCCGLSDRFMELYKEMPEHLLFVCNKCRPWLTNKVEQFTELTDSVRQLKATVDRLQGDVTRQTVHIDELLGKEHINLLNQNLDVATASSKELRKILMNAPIAKLLDNALKNAVLELKADVISALTAHVASQPSVTSCSSQTMVEKTPLVGTGTDDVVISPRQSSSDLNESLNATRTYDAGSENDAEPEIVGRKTRKKKKRTEKKQNLQSGRHVKQSGNSGNSLSSTTKKKRPLSVLPTEAPKKKNLRHEIGPVQTSNQTKKNVICLQTGLVTIRPLASQPKTQQQNSRGNWNVVSKKTKKKSNRPFLNQNHVRGKQKQLKPVNNHYQKSGTGSAVHPNNTQKCNVQSAQCPPPTISCLPNLSVPPPGYRTENMYHHIPAGSWQGCYPLINAPPPALNYSGMVQPPYFRMW